MTTTVFLYDPTTATDYEITSEVYSVDISRGRSRELDEINAGTCRVRCRNYIGNFNPYFLSDADFLLMETGDSLLLEDSGHIVLEAISTGGDYGIMSLGRKLTVYDGSTVVYTGFLEDIDLEWTAGKYKDATLIAADGLARLARQSFLEWTTTADQTTGERLTSIVARPEVDTLWATLLFDTGASLLQSDLVTHGSNVLNYCQLVNKAEQGRFYVSAFGTLVFQDRASVAAGTAVVDFRDTATGQVANQIPFSIVGVTFGSELLYTKVSVDNIDGVVQTADDATAQSNYGIRHLTFSQMLLNSDSQAADMAQYLLDRYKSPEAVVSEIRVPLEKLSSANRTTVAGLEISDTVTMNWTPTPGLGAVSQTLVIEGVGYEKAVDGATWMTFQLSAAPSNDFFILAADANASLLDTGVLGF